MYHSIARVINISLHSTIGSANGQSALSMHFNTNGRLNENNFKISLRPLSNPAKQPSLEKSPPNASTPTAVTSTNPKTPSPNTEEVDSAR